MLAKMKKLLKNKKVVVITLIAVVVAVYVLFFRPAKTTSVFDGPKAPVVRGHMTVAITASESVVDAARKKIIRNELGWDVIIGKLVPDGTLVEQGQTIIEFQCTQLENEIEDADLLVDSSQLEFDKAVKNLELQEKEMDNNIRQSGQKLLKTQEDFNRFMDEGGEREIEDSEAQSQIELAEQDLLLAEGKLDFKKEINQRPELKSPYSKSEIEADELNVKRLKRALRKAEFDREMLLKYEHPQKVRTLQTEVENAKLELERTQLIASNQLANSKADVIAKNTLLKKREEKFAELKKNFQQLTVVASEPGLVVYDTATNPWRASDVVVEVGAKISPRQQVMVIPDMSTLQVNAKVFEAVVNQLAPGETPAMIRLDAKPELILHGKVKWVAPLPDKDSPWFSTGVKTFSIVVEFADGLNVIDSLKPGMTAQLELILAELEDVLSIPIAAVFTEQQKTFVWKVGKFGPKKVEVKVGKTNASRAQILEGLDEDDKVMLIPHDGEVQKDKEKEKAKTPAPVPGI